MADLLDALFARVRPLVGDGLGGRRVAVLGSPAAGVLVDYMVTCGMRQWTVLAGNRWLDAHLARLRLRYGGMDLPCAVVASVAEIGATDLALVVDDVALAAALPLALPRLMVFAPTDCLPCRVKIALPGEKFGGEILHRVQNDAPLDPLSVGRTQDWAWLMAAPLVAMVARALLLRGTEFAMATWETAWARGLRAHVVGDAADPTRANWTPDLEYTEPRQVAYQTPLRRQGTLLIAGLGSLGSVAAQQLAPWVDRLVLVDGDRVELANLVRQNYGHDQLGAAKAVALAAALGATQPGLVCEAVVADLTDEAQVAELIRKYEVTAALVTTGTQADFAIARALRAAALPHVVGRCYARARFWEGIVVEGAGIDLADLDMKTADKIVGPSYEQVRRHVVAGPEPAPTPEEVAAYGAVDRWSGELVAEPATAMETGWAAMWLARLTIQMMVPSTLREVWLVARLAAGATCFVGGVVVEASRDGFAYGVAVPGEVHAWTVGEIETA